MPQTIVPAYIYTDSEKYNAGTNSDQAAVIDSMNKIYSLPLFMLTLQKLKNNNSKKDSSPSLQLLSELSVVMSNMAVMHSRN